ncbi:MAG: class I SAM-dependent methyltransferase [Deltaproteobacteria bacterium]|nr:class I SAM-dependent methyltransferase [Deltaproteobacteria bacterium]
MTWNRETAERYDVWAETARGSLVLGLERAFLQKMVAPWPRRKQTLLDIGSGTGFFTTMFWEAGFEVTALDASPDMLSRARARLGNKAEYRVGVAEHLPFDDNEFDFTALVTVLEFCDDPAKALAEAGRVSRKGLLLVFLNRWSFYYLSHGRPRPDRGILSRGRWLSWPAIRRLVNEALDRPVLHARSILPGPSWTWRSWPGLQTLNGLCLPPWMGAFVAVRVDLGPRSAQTPLFAWKPQARPM